MDDIDEIEELLPAAIVSHGREKLLPLSQLLTEIKQSKLDRFKTIKSTACFFLLLNFYFLNQI